MVVTDLYMGIPLLRLNVPWNDVEKGSSNDDADKALSGLLRAVYGNDSASINRYVNPRLIAELGSAESYTSAFHANLPVSSELKVYGKISDKQSVRFILTSPNEPSYRILKFVAKNGQGYVLDNSGRPTPAEMLESAIFRMDKKLSLEAVAKGEDYKTISLGSAEEPCAPALIVPVRPLQAQSTGRTDETSNAAFLFYQRCHASLGPDPGRFFSCFDEEDAAKMTAIFRGFTQMEKERFVEVQTKGIEPAFVLNGGKLTVVFYRRILPPAHQLGHQNIFESKGAFSLAGLTTSSPLDDVLNDELFQSRLLSSSAAPSTP